MKKKSRLVVILGVVLLLVIIAGAAAYVSRHNRSARNQPVNTSAAALKPQLSGATDRQSNQFSGWETTVNSFVAEVPWSAVQPTNNNAVAANNPIDQAIATARSKNMHVKLRLLAGQNSPGWAKSMTGTMNICNARGTADRCGTVPHFWEQKYETAYANYIRLLSQKYDSAPEIREVDMNGCMTIFGEQLLREPTPAANIIEYKNAGYTEAANEQCYDSTLKDFASSWPTTRVSMAFNPYQKWTGDGFTTDESYTESLMTECRNLLSKRCVLGNNSIGKDMTIASGCGGGADYASMYSKITCLGPPIYYQTATLAKLGGSCSNITDTLQWAAAHKAAMVELPSGYNTACSASTLSPLDAALEQNIVKD